MFGGQINNYGVRETAPIDEATKAAIKSAEREVYWTEPGLRITRLRLLTERGYDFFDVSYCVGTIGDEVVFVMLPFHQLPRRGWKKAIIEEAKLEGVFAKRLGILEDHNVSVLW